MLTQLEGVEKQLARLQFFQDCATPLTSVIVLVKLNREHSPAELGHFRILVQVLSIQKPGSLPTLCLAGRDGHPIRWRRDDQSTIMGVNCLVWSRQQEMERHNEPEGRQFTQRGVGTLGDLDQRHLFVYVTKPLLNRISGIGVQANDYVLAFAEQEHLVPIDIAPPTPWPEPLTEAERAVPWIELLLKADGSSLSPPDWPTKNWYLDFSVSTPSKLPTT